MFAGRVGLDSYEQLKPRFGPRWAYHLQNQILEERLDGVIFLSRLAAEYELAQRQDRAIARDQVERLIAQRPAVLTVMLHPRKYSKLLGALSPPQSA